MREQKQTGRSFGGKGYYIALILCAVAIGITGYLYYQNAGDTDPQLMQPTQDAVATLPGGDMQVIATTPTTPGGTTAAPTTPVTVGKLKTGMPVTGQTVMGYAMDCLSYNPTTRDWRVHDGLDIAAEAGTPVYAAADGTVYNVYEDDTMGTTVVIRHDGGYTTKYASLAADVAVAPGDQVALGQQIGAVGASALLETALGEHVHFSVTQADRTVDPAEFLGVN